MVGGRQGKPFGQRVEQLAEFEPTHQRLQVGGHLNRLGRSRGLGSTSGGAHDGILRTAKSAVSRTNRDAAPGGPTLASGLMVADCAAAFAPNAKRLAGLSHMRCANLLAQEAIPTPNGPSGPREMKKSVAAVPVATVGRLRSIDSGAARSSHRRAYKPTDWTSMGHPVRELPDPDRHGEESWRT